MRWNEINDDTVHLDALLAIFCKGGDYVFATGRNLPGIRIQYPNATHWKILCHQPGTYKDTTELSVLEEEDVD